jgi:hypothetical protein
MMTTCAVSVAGTTHRVKSSRKDLLCSTQLSYITARETAEG